MRLVLVDDKNRIVGEVENAERYVLQSDAMPTIVGQIELAKVVKRLVQEALTLGQNTNP